MHCVIRINLILYSRSDSHPMINVITRSEPTIINCCDLFALASGTGAVRLGFPDVVGSVRRALTLFAYRALEAADTRTPRYKPARAGSKYSCLILSSLPSRPQTVTPRIWRRAAPSGWSSPILGKHSALDLAILTIETQRRSIRTGPPFRKIKSRLCHGCWWSRAQMTIESPGSASDRIGARRRKAVLVSRSEDGFAAAHRSHVRRQDGRDRVNRRGIGMVAYCAIARCDCPAGPTRGRASVDRSAASRRAGGLSNQDTVGSAGSVADSALLELRQLNKLVDHSGGWITQLSRWLPQDRGNETTVTNRTAPDMSVTANPGAQLGMVGEPGSGNSIMLHVITGLLEGQITFVGGNVGSVPNSCFSRDLAKQRDRFERWPRFGQSRFHVIRTIYNWALAMRADLRVGFNVVESVCGALGHPSRLIDANLPAWPLENVQ